MLLAATAALSFGVAPARADVPVPQPGAACPAELTDVMTRLPDVGDFLVCQATGMWAPVLAPFDPVSRWLSYGAGITLHGQGFRNPNLRSGQWTAAPLDPSAVCSADQVTVIGPGELAPVVHSPGESGQPLHLDVLPKLFTITMNGDCLWSEDQPPGLG
ncbi:hypothetical protein CRM90_08960 [Mycobacterium sp. ENV421]|uniref:hypothetical protein n=1 Tax=Mycobacterium sp. ENV421 TaxID=1213407 RepID=UPI000C9B6E74|nr:hypothetical protein [Mycobacterium sp. ENV421]PND58111.1 hypothetical protein CRM90_08960 [Mycobacterium sp. ENV421]